MISVNDETLIGQVGGIIGITLGWCGVTVVEYIPKLFVVISKIMLQELTRNASFLYIHLLIFFM